MEFYLCLIQLSQDGPLYIMRGHRIYFPKILYYLSIDFVLANSADPDEMLHYSAFHLGFLGFPVLNG